MNAPKLRVALVGLGFSQAVLKDYLSAPSLKLALLCDIDEGKCRRVSQQYGIPYTLRFDDCLGADIDAVDVSTPNHLHAVQAVAALDAGKHVLIQKPMAPHVVDGRRIVEAARRAGRQVGLFMSSLNDPLNHELRAMIAGGAFGALLSLRGRAAHRSAQRWDPQQRPDRPADYWRRRKELVGGGGMALLGIHMINLLPWLAGSPVESVVAFAANVASREIIEGDDIAAAVARLRCGALATLEASYASERNVVEVYGNRGYAIVQDSVLRLKLDAPWKGRLLDVPAGETVLGPADLDPLRAPLRIECEQHEAFARSILAGVSPPVTGADGLRDVAVLGAIYRSAESGRMERPEE